MKEQWKEIKGNREIYEVSNLGNVRTKDREKRGSENLWINWFYSKKYADSLEYIELE